MNRVQVLWLVACLHVRCLRQLDVRYICKECSVGQGGERAAFYVCAKR